ncbi:hypothetical protein FACS1894181_16000 [Bacteroidia bacterium]|nr:hypothetical protein FACS1894181_16000 [Bacteroidia bacterium]
MVRVISLLTSFLLFLAACTSEEIITGGSPNGSIDSNIQGGGDTAVNFSLKVPAQLQTRAALSESDENAVHSISLLLFEKVNGDAIYRFRTHVTNINSVSPTQKTFSASLPKGSFDLVVLANAEQILAASSFTYGHSKEDVLNSLVEQNTGKWQRTTIPMWGKRDNLVINAQTNLTGNNAIDMVRMVAKIELEVTPQAAGSGNSNFSLLDIRLYNYSSQGALVPGLASWPSDNIAVAPTQPSVPGGYGVLSYPANSPLLFDSSDGVTPNGCERIIYAYEAPAGNGGSAQATNTCLVVGGSYKGGPVSYYRIDFVKQANGPTAYLPLLRNYRYSLKVLEVNGEGAPTPGGAFEAGPANIVANVLNWDESSMNDVIFDSQHMLGISSSRFYFSDKEYKADADDNKLTIQTTVPSGWTVEKITDASGMAGTAPWLTVSEASFASPGIPRDVFIYATANFTNAERIGYIYIRSGKLVCPISVVQAFYLGNPGSSSVKATVPSMFVMDGNRKSITVQANVSWQITSVEDPKGIITDATQLIGLNGGSNLSVVSDEIKFNMVNDITQQKIKSATASIRIEDAFGREYILDINGATLYEIGNLLMWYEDQPIDRTWYVYADVPDNYNNTAVPPLGDRYPKGPRQYSCAGLDPGNKNLWRLPTRDEMYTILAYVRNNGGYSKYDMINVDFTGADSGQNTKDTYWTATSSTAAVAYAAGYNTQATTGNSGPHGYAAGQSKSSTGPDKAGGGYKSRARCVRTK